MSWRRTRRESRARWPRASARKRIRFRILLHMPPNIAEGSGDVAARGVDDGEIFRELTDAHDIARFALRKFAARREQHATVDRYVAGEQSHRGHAVVERVLRIRKREAAFLADDRP